MTTPEHRPVLPSAVYRRLFPVKNKAGDRTKLKIVEAVIDLLSGQGLESLTFGAVGEKIGINAAQVKYHFPEKMDLVERALEYVGLTVQETVIQRLEHAKGWKSQALATLNGYFDWAQRYPNQARLLLLLYYMASIHPRFHDFYNRMYDSGTSRMRSILAAARVPRTWTAKELDQLAVEVWGIADGLMIYYIATRPQDDPDYFRKQALKAANLLLKRIAQGPTKGSRSKAASGK